jgi:(+)-trans-carveol dehydrogenase
MAKHAVVGLMRTLANELAPSMIRANSIHASSTFTKMINNPAIWDVFSPGIENPTEDDFRDTFESLNMLPVRWAEPVDISHAVVYLASDEARYVTGVTLPVDSGFMEKI